MRSPILLVESDVRIILDVLAVPERSPESHSDGCLIAHVILAEDLLDMLGGLLSVVEGHVGEQMVRHMGVCDVMEEVVEDWAEGSVHCAQSPTEPGPFLFIEVRHVHIRVLQVGDQNKVKVHYQVGNEVETDPSTKSKGVDNPSKNR